MQMTTMLRGDSSRHGLYNGGTSRNSQEKPEDGGRWYFSRKEIEEDSPSRRDGISLNKETYIRKSYCRFLQDSGLRLKVSPVTIATATIFCHRFFIRQSLAKNDWQTIAIVCMFLAGKAEETPRQLKDVILVSYEVIHKKDPAAMQRIKQKEVYEKQKEVILLGERVVLGTIGFDFNVPNPYKPLVEAIKKFKVAQDPRAPEVAWSFLNDALGTSLCLQFKPHLIAAGAIYLAAKYLKLKLPSDGDKIWWQEFDVTPHQLKEVTNQMLDLYYEEREVPRKASVGTEELAARRSNSQGAASLKPGDSKTASSRPLPEQSNAGKHVEPLKTTQKQNAVNRHLHQLAHLEDTGETERVSRVGSGENVVEDQEKFSGRREAGELKLRCNDEPVGQPSQEVIEKIDKQNRSSPREKRKMPQVDLSRGKYLADEDSHILAAETENANGGRRQSWGNTTNCSEASEYENGHWRNHPSRESELRCAQHVKNVEVEVDATDDAYHGYLDSSYRNKRKACCMPEQYTQETRQHDKCHGLPQDRNKLHKLGG